MPPCTILPPCTTSAHRAPTIVHHVYHLRPPAHLSPELRDRRTPVRLTPLQNFERPPSAEGECFFHNGLPEQQNESINQSAEYDKRVANISLFVYIGLPGLHRNSCQDLVARRQDLVTTQHSPVTFSPIYIIYIGKISKNGSQRSSVGIKSGRNGRQDLQ